MSTAARPTVFDEFLLLLGRLNYTWTNTESLLIHLIAGLSRTDTETALVIFLTLNTTRARIDLVERLSKLERTPPDLRREVLRATKGLMRHSPLRNRYNHCIYAFDRQAGTAQTILMRIADRKDRLKMGQAFDLDVAAAQDVETAIAEIGLINRDIWRTIRDFGYPA